MKAVYVGTTGVVFHAAVFDEDGRAKPRCGISRWGRALAIFDVDENDPDQRVLACRRCWPHGIPNSADAPERPSC